MLIKETIVLTTSSKTSREKSLFRKERSKTFKMQSTINRGRRMNFLLNLSRSKKLRL